MKWRRVGFLINSLSPGFPFVEVLLLFLCAPGVSLSLGLTCQNNPSIFLILISVAACRLGVYHYWVGEFVLLGCCYKFVVR